LQSNSNQTLIVEDIDIGDQVLHHDAAQDPSPIVVQWFLPRVKVVIAQGHNALQQTPETEFLLKIKGSAYRPLDFLWNQLGDQHSEEFNWSMHSQSILLMDFIKMLIRGLCEQFPRLLPFDVLAPLPKLVLTCVSLNIFPVQCLILVQETYIVNRAANGTYNYSNTATHRLAVKASFSDDWVSLVYLHRMQAF